MKTKNEIFNDDDKTNKSNSYPNLEYDNQNANNNNPDIILFNNNDKIAKSNDFLNLKNSNIISNNNNYFYYSKIIKDNIVVPSKKEDIFLRLNSILKQENQSKEYQAKILNIFKDLIIYIKEKNPKSVKTKIGKDGKVLNIIRRINIKDVFNFINSNSKYSRQKSKNSILSRIRKFVRILNC